MIDKICKLLLTIAALILVVSVPLLLILFPMNELKIDVGHFVIIAIIVSSCFCVSVIFLVNQNEDLILEVRAYNHANPKKFVVFVFLIPVMVVIGIRKLHEIGFRLM